MRVNAVVDKSTAIPLAFAMLLVGCVQSATQSDDPVAWEEPGWLSVQRQQQDEYESSMRACLAEKGVNLSVGFGGSIGLSSTIDPAVDSVVYADALGEIQMEVLYGCYQQVGGLPEMWQMPPNEQTYAMLLDVVECIRVHGFDVAEPPSLEVWREQTPPWNPYESFVGTLPDEQLQPLMDVCQQVGPGRIEVFGAD